MISCRVQILISAYALVMLVLYPVSVVGVLALGGKEGKEAYFLHVDPHWVEETLANTCRFLEGEGKICFATLSCCFHWIQSVSLTGQR